MPSLVGGKPKKGVAFGGGNAPSGTPPMGGGGGGNTPPINISTQENPQINALLGEMGDWRKSLAAGNDRDATNAMQRQRDLASGQMKEFGAMAAARGAGRGSGASNLMLRRGMDASNRNLAGLNADLTSDARRQYGNALGQAGSLAVGQAGVTLGQQQFGLSAWNSQQNAAHANAQLQALQNQNMFDNMMRVYTGFGGR